ncbi:two-component regulator propeller domain-containing protein [Dokdonella ginsengisoli]|uniref:two-component regulator propeller domain-containing protein n=1 Tax=Dokdonella ginsengisoli TaxID=363846 RepID=UPI0036D2BBEB
MCASVAHAAPDEAAGHAPYRSYGPADGLPSVYIRTLLQDRPGFVWVGTDTGLYRYDGQRFQAFGLRDGLRSASVGHLLEDRDGTLWVGTRGGLHRWNGESFVAAATDQDPSEAAIRALAENAEGVWIIAGAADRGPLLRDTDGRFAAVPDWPGGAATALAGKADARSLWVGVWDGSRAHVLRRSDGHWQRIALAAGTEHERIDALFEDAQGRLWVRQPNRLSAKPRDGEFAAAATPLPVDAQSGALLADPRGGFWLPTEAGLLHHDDDHWQRVQGPVALSAQWCRMVLVDREGSLWWGSAGLHRQLGGGAWSAYTAREGLPGDVVWAVLRDRAQRLWVATNSGAAVLATTGFRRVPGSEGKDLRTIAQAPDGRLFLAGRIGAELLSLDPRDDTLTRLPFAGLAASARVLRLHVDRAGTLWAATSDGLYHAEADAVRPQFARVGTADAAPDGPVPDGPLADVREDASGRLWIAGQRGLWMRDGERWRRFGRADGLRRDFVAHVLPTSSGDLFVGYGDPLGVARVRYEQGRLRVLRHHDSDSGSADAVYLVGEDAARRHWLGGPQGIDRLAGESQRHFGLADGLVGEDVASGAFLAEADGRVWIGTSAGLARFDGAAYEHAPRPPPPNVALMDVHLGAARWSPDQPEPRVAHDRNVLEARLAGLGYLAGHALQYRVRLAGLEPEAHVTTSPNLRFSGLAPGSYRLEAAARSGPDGPWGPPSTLAFEVRPAWWQTSVFRAALVLAATLLLLQLLHWRTALLRRRNRQLDAQVGERTAALQVAVERLRDEVGQRAAAERALAAANVEERRRTERFSLIAHIASILSSNLDADALAQRAASSLREVLGCEQVDIPLADGTGRLRPAAATPAAAHALDVPILLGEERLGAIRVRGARPFDDLDASSLAIVADCLAVAIENAHLFGRAQEVAVVAERQRVAHDLHDNVMQILASIRMRAQTLARHGRGQSEASTRHADRLAELARIAVAEMRAYVEQLRPDEANDEPGRHDGSAGYLHDRSLPNAVQRLLATAVPDGVRVVCDFEQFPPQAFEHEEALFRVCQEAVSNAVRHSGASTLEVSGRIAGAAARIRVVDDGCGLPEGVLRQGIGLDSMRRRIAALGGRVRIGAGARCGTEVEAELPRADRAASGT